MPSPPSNTSSSATSSTNSSNTTNPTTTTTTPPPTCPTSHLSLTEAALRADINRRLLESGEFEKLSAHLTELLRESGWYEVTTGLCNKVLRDPEAAGKIVSYGGLYSAIEREAVEKVEREVKVEVVRKIREVVEGLVEG